MSIGPVEIVVIEVPKGWAPGGLRARVAELVDAGTVQMVDALLVTKAEDGTVDGVELEDAGEELASLFGDLGQQLDLISAEDAEALAEDLGPGRTALALAFEHTWMAPVRDSLVASGGELIADIHISAPVVAEVLASVEPKAKLL